MGFQSMKFKMQAFNRALFWLGIVVSGLVAIGEGAPSEVLQLLGSIVAKSGAGVALVKHRPTATIKALKVGEDVFGFGRLLYVDRYEMRLFSPMKGSIIIFSRFGGDSRRLQKGPVVDSEDRYIEDGFQRIGNKIQVDARYRDRIVREELPKVLMEASSEPVMKGGQIVGFRLFQFDEKSMFHKLGIKDGDVVSEINGVPLNNVTRTVQLLNGLRGEGDVKVKVMRNGTPISLDMSVR